jgi:hypothetical protein
VPWPVRQPLAKGARLLGVIEDDQPSGPLVQVAEHRAADHVRRGVVPGAAELPGQLGELLGEQRGVRGVQPPHHVVVVLEAVRVLDGQLRLADAAHAVQGLDGRPVAGKEGRADVGELLLAAGEGRVPRRHVTPGADGRRHGCR